MILYNCCRYQRDWNRPYNRGNPISEEPGGTSEIQGMRLVVSSPFQKGGRPVSSRDHQAFDGHRPYNNQASKSRATLYICVLSNVCLIDRRMDGGDDTWTNNVVLL